MLWVLRTKITAVNTLQGILRLHVRQQQAKLVSLYQVGTFLRQDGHFLHASNQQETPGVPAGVQSLHMWAVHLCCLLTSCIQDGHDACNNLASTMHWIAFDVCIHATAVRHLTNTPQIYETSVLVMCRLEEDSPQGKAQASELPYPAESPKQLNLLTRGDTSTIPTEHSSMRYSFIQLVWIWKRLAPSLLISQPKMATSRLRLAITATSSCRMYTQVTPAAHLQ